MAVILSELRVSASMDASGFTAGAALIESANRRMAESGQAAGATFAAQDAAAGRTGGTMVSLSKSYIDGYAGVARFSQQIAQLQTQFELGNVKADRAALIYTGLAAKFQLYASATEIAAKGNRDFAAVIDSVNARAAARIDIIGREVAAINSLAQAQTASQSAIFKSIGATAPGAGAGSAQASADAFLSDAGGLAGIAKARAAQTAQAFTSELDARLITGIGKSARDSASVFQKEFTKLDEISRLRAEQVGQEFQRSLNERMGIGAVPKSARESAAVFQELGQQTKVAGTAFAGFNAIAGYGTTQFMALTAAMRHGFDAMAAGMSPMRVVMMEMGNLSYGFSGSGGFMGAMKALGTTALSLLSPVIVTFAAIGSAVAGATVSLLMFESAQRNIARQLLGSGLASGATPGSINKIAQDASSAFGLSISEARTLAATLAATGKIGVDAITPVVKIGHDLAVMLGDNATEAAKKLASGLADPVKGFDEFNKLLGIGGAAMRQDIANFKARGQILEAQKLLTSALAAATKEANTVISTSANMWTALGNGISYAWNKLGEWGARATGIGLNLGLDEKIASSQDRIAALQKQIDNFSKSDTAILRPGAINILKKALQDERAELEKLQGAWSKYGLSVEEAQRRRDSFATKEAIGKSMPELAQLRAAQNELMLLSRRMDEVNKTGGAQSPILAEVGETYGQLATSIRRAKGEVELLTAANGDAKSSFEKLAESMRLSISFVGKKGPEAAGRLAYEQAILQYGKSDEAVGNAGLARDLAILNARQQILEATKARNLASQQSTEMAGLELQLVGKTSFEQERQRGLLQAKQQLEQAALQTYGSREAYDRKHLAALEEEINKQAAIKRETALAQINDQIRFDRRVTFLNPEDVQIARQLKDAFNNDIPAALASSEAAAIRLNNAFRDFSDTSRDTLKGFAQDMRTSLQAGATAWESFQKAGVNALNKIADKLMDMAINNLWSLAFGGGGGGFNIFSLFGMGGGGGGLPGADGLGFARGGVMTSHGAMPLNRYAGGGVASSPQIALFGEGRSPEAYVPLPDGRSIPVNISVPQGYGQGGSTVVNVSQVNNITGSPEMSKEEFAALLAKNNKQLTKEINAALPDRVAAINRDPRRRG